LWLPPALLVLAGLSGCASVAPLGSVLLPGAAARVELLDAPFFPQEDHQCGPSALATVLEASGTTALPEQLVAEVYLPGRQGSLQQELLAAARRRGRLAYVLPGDAGALLAELQAGRPVLILQNLGVDAYPIWHYAVLVGFDAKRNEVILRSGRAERLVMSWPRFEGSWRRGGRWAMTVLAPGTLPARPSLPEYLDACAGLEAAGMSDEAAAAYLAAAQRWPASPLVELGRGNVAFARGDLPGALAAYRRGIGLSPSDAALRNNLAQALLDSGCANQALVEARRANELARGMALEAVAGATLESVLRAVASGDSSASCADPTRGDGDAQPLSLRDEAAGRSRDR
jgi:tetratricopeptide (TPR) repeat protein